VSLRRLAGILTLSLLLLLASESGGANAASGSSRVAGASVADIPECGPSGVQLSAGTQGASGHNLVTLVVVDSRRESSTLFPPTQVSVVALGVEHTVEVGKLPKTLNKRLVLGSRRYGSVRFVWGNWCGTKSGVSVHVRFGATRPPWTAVVDQQRVPTCGSSNGPPGISLDGWGYEGPLASGVYAGVPSFPKGFASETRIISQ
jgi:hypothetical protein